METQETPNQLITVEQARNLRAVVSSAIEATKKISGALLNIVGDVFGMFRK
jgi:hypothetical protein